MHARYLEGKEKLVAHLMTLKAVFTTAGQQDGSLMLVWYAIGLLPKS